MEDFVTTVKVYSADRNWTQLAEYIGSSLEMLKKNAGKIDSAIAVLDPEEHTLGFLSLLLVKINLPSYGDFELLLSQMQQFLTLMSRDQIQHGIDNFNSLCHFITDCLIERSEAQRGIKMMITAVQKSQLHPSQLTPIHADLVQLCLIAKCFKPALELIEVDFTDIQKEGGQVNSKYFLLFYYYSGMLYTAVKKYDQALFFFEVAVTIPAVSVSLIMLECYKKFILVSLLVHGKISILPKYTSTVVHRFLKPLSTPYQELAAVFSQYNSSQLRTFVDKHQQIFRRDNNMGLVKQVLVSLYKRNIQRLTKTFLTLSLSDMATRVQLDSAKEAENYLVEMIEEGEIYATIDQKRKMVSFHENPDKYNTLAILQNINTEMLKSMELDEKLQQMDKELATNTQYVHKVIGMAQLDEAGKGDELMV